MFLSTIIPDEPGIRRPENEKSENAAILTIQILAFLLVFAVPVGLLLLLFPKHTEAIIMISVYTLFGISALFAGVGWNEPAFGPEAKSYTKWIIAFTVVAMAVSRWFSFPEQDEVEWALGILPRAAVLILPFFLGKFISNQIYHASKPKKK